MQLIAKEGPFSGLILKLESGEEWIIGNNPDEADFVLEDSKIAAAQAELSKSEEGLYIQNLRKENPLFVNGEEVTEKRLLKEGDKIGIGNSLFLFSNEEEYETIFEEEVEKIDLGKGERFILKVMSGPNAGAEFGLEMGKSYLLGKDSTSSDIVFRDLSISKNHAKISISEEGKLYIEDLGSKNKTRVNSVIIEARAEFYPNDTITIGTTSFIIIDSEAALETIYAPVEEVRAPKEEIKKVPEVNWKKEPINPKYLILGVSVCITVFIVILSFFSLFKSEKVVIPQKDLHADIKKTIEKYSNVEFSYNQSQESLFLTGHVLTPIDHKELIYKLKELSFIKKIEDKIIVDEYVWKNMNAILSSHEKFRKVSIHSPKAGKYVLTGYMQTPEEVEELIDYLNVNFPYLDRLENDVVVENLLNLQISNQILAQGLSAITFQLSNGEIILSGLYAEDNKEKFKNLMNYIKKMRGIRSIKNLALTAKPDMARIDLSSKYSISGVASKGSNAISVIINGQIISLGDALDGMIITDIKPNVILLEKDGIKYKINYNQ